jgi:hypothetical protein
MCEDKALRLRFHDLRHEAISRLFEADWDIPEVAAERSQGLESTEAVHQFETGKLT